MTGSLTGIDILVTRPAHQAGELADRILGEGGSPVLFPVLEILDIPNPHLLLNLIERLDEFDIAIFISPNAVVKAMHLISAKRTLPVALKVIAVGQGTAKELKNFGVTGVVAPTSRFDSEAMLDLPLLRQVKGKRVVIFRGDKGREMLAENLLKRGGVVEYAECYHRVRPESDIAPLLSAWTTGKMKAITITSSEGLRNLCDMVGKTGEAWLKKTPLFVSHARIAQVAGELGFTRVVLTAAGDDGLLKGLLNYFCAETTRENCGLEKP